MISFDTASLGIKLSSKSHNISEIKLIVDTIENIPMASFWSLVTSPQIEDQNTRKARDILKESVLKSKSGGRFYPGFYNLYRKLSNNLQEFPFSEFPFPDYSNYDPFDSLDIGVMYGMNIWARREIYKNDRELFHELFSYAEVTKLEHHSPLLIELTVAIAIPSLPILLTYGLMRAIISYRKAEAEAIIREKEAKIKDEESKQKRLQTQILEYTYEGIKQQSTEKEIRIPEEVLKNLANISISTVSDLGESPLIGNLTFGISSKSK